MFNLAGSNYSIFLPCPGDADPPMTSQELFPGLFLGFYALTAFWRPCINILRQNLSIQAMNDKGFPKAHAQRPSFRSLFPNSHRISGAGSPKARVSKANSVLPQPYPRLL